MTDYIEKLRHEIEELEKQIAAHPFEGLYDRKRSDQLQHKLKKKRKELAQLEGNYVPPTAPIVKNEPEPMAVAAPKPTPPVKRAVPKAKPTPKPKAKPKPKPAAKSKAKPASKPKAKSKSTTTKKTATKSTAKSKKPAAAKKTKTTAKAKPKTKSTKKPKAGTSKARKTR